MDQFASSGPPTGNRCVRCARNGEDLGRQIFRLRAHNQMGTRFLAGRGNATVLYRALRRREFLTLSVASIGGVVACSFDRRV